MKTTIHAELPPKLLAEAEAFVKQGSVKDLNELIADALRRYLESHSRELEEEFLREDVKWGMHGRT